MVWVNHSCRQLETVDTVITNALIIDHWGIIKADVGIKDGRISGIERQVILMHAGRCKYSYRTWNRGDCW